MSNRECMRCHQLKPLSEYYIRKSGKRAGEIKTECKPCYKETVKSWRLRNPEANAVINKRARLKSKYGLSLEEVPEFGNCPICLEDRKLVVDHCHSKGHVRGFICHNCNTLLGHVENTDKMERIREYLKGRYDGTPE